ncbi:glycosyltransferase [Agromyces sp. Marseille-P2726]|uniref:glycosyltransferase n=1 Tax=Agromyces sp. Marseille-P2726 TaxID=2709132 RepID=UPI00156F4606|nr:nucleotide disphospho-sugar-binding domain-containing protein [Agromyces sp. Marseille-P2726]
MPSAIVCSVPAYGHVRPMLAVASALRDRGWRVRFVTGIPFADDVRKIGVEFVPLTPEYDTVLTPPENGRASLNHTRHVFFGAVPAQVRLLRGLLAEEPADAVVNELAFIGTRVLLSDPPERRPIVVSCSVFPLMLSGPDTAPFGPGLPPATTAARRGRYRLLTAFTKHVALRPIHRSAEKLLASIGAPGLDGRLFMDAIADADLLAQFSVTSFEYPRPDAPASLRFFGPPAPSLPSLAPLPDWWDRLDERPVVHVTQGTSFNDDFERLVAPTLRALADRPVQVVVATAGRPLDELPALPPNAFAAEYLPYDRLFERTAVLVTNGGFGTVNEALGYGVPIVVGSGFGDQVETAARVAWSGVGIDLGRRIPEERRIAVAVDRILADPSYRQAAQRIGREIRASEGAAGVARWLEERIAEREPAPA